MEASCLDMGCISTSDKHRDETSRRCDPKEPQANYKATAACQGGKSKSPKGLGQSTLNALNRFALHIKNPSLIGSPLNWFPRKKSDSYLNRKIKMLQEEDGNNTSLDEALGDSNLHYSKVLKEKIAAREAASTAMEAQKDALVEASWCRILRAARIQSKEAETRLAKAEEASEEALKVAMSLGVIMYDKPGCERKAPLQMTEAIAATHMVTVSFENSFDVDKEVAAAVKTAFIRLANCPCFDEHEFKHLLQKFNQNPPNKMDDGHTEFAEQESEMKPEKLVDTMAERLRCLKDNELSLLATIVATCGLNAALAKPERNVDSESTTELQSLDKVLVKHVSKLEKEIAEAKKISRNTELEDAYCKRREPTDAVPDLGSVLVKHFSKFEKEIQEAKKKCSEEEKVVSNKATGSLHGTETKEQVRSSVSRMEARDKELKEAWGGLSLQNSLRPHLSVLERDKENWIKAEEEERRRSVSLNSQPDS